MRAFVAHTHDVIENSPLVLTDLPMPEPGPSDIRVKVHCCAICRTDLHVIEGDLPRRKMPLTPGHQIVGTIDKCGISATRFAVGARVGIAWLRSTCQHCHYCQTGRENLCEAAAFTGYHADGGYAEYAVVHQDYAYQIPAIFTDAEASPLLCAGIIGYRSLQRARLPKGGRLGIYGFGSSAHIVMQLARHRGCEVYVMTRDRKHRELAVSLGATWVGAETEKAPRRFDSAIIFAPAGRLIPIALEALDKGGTLSLAGIHMSAIPSLNYEQHLFYEKNIHSVTANTRQDGVEFLHEAASIPLRPHTTPFIFEHANEALQALKNDGIQGAGVLMM